MNVKTIVIDGGNHTTKAATNEGVFSFSSAMDVNYDLNTIDNKYGSDDMAWEFEGQTGIAGTIAEFEGAFANNRTFGGTKNHFVAKMRILLAIHQFANTTDVNIVVASPFGSHLNDKDEIKQSLEKKHSPLTVNGVTKTINIHKCNVTVEGAAAFYSTNIPEEVVRVVDIGSGTVNCITFIKGIMVRDQSRTLDFGTETETTGNILEQIPGNVYNGMSSKHWKLTDRVYLCGTAANEIEEHMKKVFPNTSVIKPTMIINNEVVTLEPKYATVVGMLRLANNIYG